MRFYLGTHMPHWLAETHMPLFVSRTRLFRYPKGSLPKANAPWAMDSGGFTEVTQYGGWRITAEQYAGQVRKAYDGVGKMDWAAPQDWMCEPIAVKATGLSVLEHQRRTVANYLELWHIAPDLPFIPVVQGWHLADYLRCVDMYEQAGVDLTSSPTVGVGSVCRRQRTDEISDIMAALHARGLSLHGFGVKSEGLRKYARYLVSADSLSWSARGYRVRPCGHGTAKSEANCYLFAVGWRQKVLNVLEAA